MDGEFARISRRRFLVGGGALAGAALLGQALPSGALRRLGVQALGPAVAHASSRFVPSMVLDTANPLADFTAEGGEPWTPGPTSLNLNDRSISDLITFYASEPQAAAGRTLDVVAEFQVVAGTPAGADGGTGVVINDGVTTSVVVRCIIKDGIRGVGIAANSRYSESSNYPIFVEADWTAPTSFRVRRTAAGDGQIIELNGTRLVPLPTLSAVNLPSRSRLIPTIEFGCPSVEATANVNWSTFRSEVEAVFAAEVQPPVNADGTSTFNANRGIVPLKFTLTENGTPICELPLATLRLSRTGGTSPGPIDESVYSGPADSGSDFRIAECKYHYNVNARALGAGSYLAEILIDGAVVGATRFELK
jgi:hypothetical protein